MPFRSKASSLANSLHRGLLHPWPYWTRQLSVMSNHRWLLCLHQDYWRSNLLQICLGLIRNTKELLQVSRKTFTSADHVQRDLSSFCRRVLTHFGNSNSSNSYSNCNAQTRARTVLVFMLHKGLVSLLRGVTSSVFHIFLTNSNVLLQEALLLGLFPLRSSQWGPRDTNPRDSSKDSLVDLTESGENIVKVRSSRSNRILHVFSYQQQPPLSVKRIEEHIFRRRHLDKRASTRPRAKRGPRRSRRDLRTSPEAHARLAQDHFGRGCPSRSVFVHPKVAFSVSGRWMFIVNMPGVANHQQGIQATECL